MAITLPLRIPTTMRTGVVTKTRTVRRTIRGRGKRRQVNRRLTVQQASRTRIAFGRQVKIGGTLEKHDGQPVEGAEVHVFSRNATTPEQLLGVVRTDHRGRYTYVARASSTRTLRFVYAGTPVMLPVAREVAPPGTRCLQRSVQRPRRVSNGEAVRFSGRLRSLPTSAGGKLVELSGHPVGPIGRHSDSANATWQGPGESRTASGAAAVYSATSSVLVCPPRRATPLRLGIPASHRSSSARPPVPVSKHRMRAPWSRPPTRRSSAGCKTRAGTRGYGRTAPGGSEANDERAAQEAQLRQRNGHSLAVFIALGGSSYAALSIQWP